jgi:hypothetical protein
VIEEYKERVEGLEEVMALGQRRLWNIREGQKRVEGVRKILVLGQRR